MNVNQIPYFLPVYWDSTAYPRADNLPTGLITSPASYPAHILNPSPPSLELGVGPLERRSRSKRRPFSETKSMADDHQHKRQQLEHHSVSQAQNTQVFFSSFPAVTLTVAPAPITVSPPMINTQPQPQACYQPISSSVSLTTPSNDETVSSPPQTTNDPSASRLIFHHTLQKSLFGCVKKAWDKEKQQMVAVKVSSKTLVRAGKTDFGVPVAEGLASEMMIMRLLSSPSAFPLSLSAPPRSSLSFSMPQQAPLQPPADLTRLIEKGVNYCLPPYDIIENEDSFLIISKFVEGVDLFTFLNASARNEHDSLTKDKSKDRKLLTEKEAKPIFFKLALGLAYLHTRGIAHRDLSLENVMVSVMHENEKAEDRSSSADNLVLNSTQNKPVDTNPSDQTTKQPISYNEVDTSLLSVHIIDFGVACLHPVAHSPSHADRNPAPLQMPPFRLPAVPEKGPKPGKTLYMAPELWSGNESGYDAFACDMFSYGVMLYCCLTGKPPHNNSADKWARHILTSRWSTHGQRCRCPCHSYPDAPQVQELYSDDPVKLMRAQQQAAEYQEHLQDLRKQQQRQQQNSNTSSGIVLPSKKHSCVYESCQHYEHYRFLSPLAMDLLSRLLCYEPQRLNVLQVLSHPWFQSM